MVHKSVTIHELAKAAGVSIASVSRALNGKPGISEALRAKILALSEEVDYKPNTMARRLIVGNKAIVALSMPAMPYEFSDRPYFVHLYQAFTLYLHQRGLVPVLFKYDDLDDIPKQASSAILLGATDDDRPERLEKMGVPFVAIELGLPSSVMIDEEKGVYQMTQYLIDKGRQQVLFFGESIDIATSQLRVRGYRRAIAANHMHETIETVGRGVNSSLSAYRHVLALLKSAHFNYDAVVCANDELAMGVITALTDSGLRVPEDVAVTGFDDLPGYAKQLTTVHQDIGKIAETAVQLLLERLEGATPRSVMIPVRLVFRDSA